MHQDEAVLSDYNEDSFNRAFSFFEPGRSSQRHTRCKITSISEIQGTVDSSDKLSQAEFSKTIDFLIKAFDPSSTNDSTKTHVGEGVKDPAREGQLSAEDLDALRAIRTHHGSVVRNIDSFTTDIVDEFLPRLERGHWTLVQADVMLCEGVFDGQGSENQLEVHQFRLGAFRAMGTDS